MKHYLVSLVNKNLPKFCIISLFLVLRRIAPNTLIVLLTLSRAAACSVALYHVSLQTRDRAYFAFRQESMTDV